MAIVRANRKPANNARVSATRAWATQHGPVKGTSRSLSKRRPPFNGPDDERYQLGNTTSYGSTLGNRT